MDYLCSMTWIENVFVSRYRSSHVYEEINDETAKPSDLTLEILQDTWAETTQISRHCVS